MSAFDIEQCKKDGGLVIYKSVEARLVTYDFDESGCIPILALNGYNVVHAEQLSNIPKKKKRV